MAGGAPFKEASSVEKLPLLVRETRKLEVRSSSPYTLHVVFIVIAGCLLKNRCASFACKNAGISSHVEAYETPWTATIPRNARMLSGGGREEIS
jgi:hypothetical protein